MFELLDELFEETELNEINDELATTQAAHETSVESQDEALEISENEMKELETIADDKKEDISFLGESKEDGWCSKSICQGEYSSYACSGCTGKASSHETKINGQEK